MENKFNIGQLDTLVTLQSCVMSKGTQGQKVMSFTDYGQVWAQVTRTVSESVNDLNLEAGSTVSLMCYKVASLTTRWRVKISNRSYEILDIDPISRTSPVNRLTLHAIE